MPYPLEGDTASTVVSNSSITSVDPAMENLLYETETGIQLGKVPDEATTINFRCLLERHGFKLLETVNGHLAGQGARFRKGMLVKTVSPTGRSG